MPLYSASNITLSQTETQYYFEFYSWIKQCIVNFELAPIGHNLQTILFITLFMLRGGTINLNFGPSEPLIVVIEKATDSSNNLLKIHEFELSFDRLSAKQIDATVSITPVGLAALEQYYGTDLNKNAVASNMDNPKFQ